MAYPRMRRDGWRQAWRRRLQRVRDRLPVACVLCGERAAGALCEHCRVAVGASMKQGARCPRCDLVQEALAGEDHSVACPDCASLGPAFERVVAAFDYAWPGDLLVHRLKLERQYFCAPVMAKLLAERCARASVEGGASCAWVVPVPASQRSLRLRGFNPAAELGRELALRLDLEWRPGLLRRVREAEFQKGLGRSARREGVEGLYACAESVLGREILVVDDVMTTGATLNAVASVLKAAGASRVWGAVAARTPIRREE